MFEDKNKIGSFNLDEIAKQQGLDVHIKSTKNENPKDADLRRLKDKSLFFLILSLIFITVLGAMIFIICKPESQNENLLISGIFSLVSLVAGYYVRGKDL